MPTSPPDASTDAPPDLALDHLLRSTRQLVDTTRALAAAGFAPATSGNFSVRLDATRFLVTASGRDKSRLGDDDVVAVDLGGTPVRGSTARRPSAETPLHAQLYRRFRDAGAVLHTHSRHQTIASRLWAAAGAISLTDFEMIKAFAGHDTHDATFTVPVFRNTQDMPALAREVDAYVDRAEAEGRAFLGYLIEGHGLYTWGVDLDDARRHLEALDFLLDCELELRRLRP